jgi:dUTPase
MVLNYEKIIDLNLIEEYHLDEFSNGSYNLRISEIIDMDNNKHQSFTLKPQGMVYVIFKEKITLPKNIIGFAHVKTSLTKRGIMATNIGVIDPNYVGYISTLLINFGKTDYLVLQDESALKITFSKLKKTKKDIVLKSNNRPLLDYVVETQKNILNLDEKFLNLNNVEKTVQSKVSDSVFTRIRNAVGVFAAASFLIAVIFQFKACNEKNNDYYISNYEVQLKTVIETNTLLVEKLKKVEDNFKSLKDSLNQVNKNEKNGR